MSVGKSPPDNHPSLGSLAGRDLPLPRLPYGTHVCAIDRVDPSFPVLHGDDDFVVDDYTALGVFADNVANMRPFCCVLYRYTVFNPDQIILGHHNSRFRSPVA